MAAEKAAAQMAAEAAQHNAADAKVHNMHAPLFPSVLIEIPSLQADESHFSLRVGKPPLDINLFRTE